MQTTSVDPFIGTTLGAFQIERLLGQGELSSVYLAQQPALGRKAMITVFHLPAGITAQQHSQFYSRFTQEGAELTRFTHPNILPTYNFGEQGGHPYLVTAFVKGASLRQAIKRQGRISTDQALAILKQVASALDYAHSKNVAHGMLSLSHIVIDQEQKI